MTRNRKSARDAGRAFETATAAYLADALADDRIEVRARNGAKDRGDVGGIRTPHGGRLVVECKNTPRMTRGAGATDALDERGNDDALAAVIVHKRRGVGLTAASMGRQYVTCTLDDLVGLLTGHRNGMRADA